MATQFNWFRPGYKLVTSKFEWNVQLPFLQNTDEDKGDRKNLLFPTQDTSNRNFVLAVINHAEQIRIMVLEYTSEKEEEANFENKFVNPIQVKMSILNKKGTKVLQKMVSSNPDYYWVDIHFSKKDIIQSKCQQSDGSLTLSCTILSHVVKKESVSSSADSPVLAVDCTGGLSSHLEELFNNMSLSDVSFDIRRREFPAHKNILAARSKYFAAMFKHPMKEQSTNQIEIEDIEPDVFQELLRFIYTGRVRTATMETMATGLFIAADKYLLDELKMKCENYLVHHMSPENCVVLLLHGNLLNPAKPLKEAVKFLRRFPNEVIATDGWKKIKKENPILLCDIHQFVLCLK